MVDMPKTKTVYDIIKRQNGETFAKAIRNYDSGIFDVPNLPRVVRYAGRDVSPDLLRWLEGLKKVKIKTKKIHENPLELLSRVGYDAYVADTLEKQNAISRYFAHGEELCTFRDKKRFENYYIINAVRRDVDKITRFAEPMREDAYATSVISIQVLKLGGFISIKNRYNHSVECPDNTFNSNPDNIIDGLGDAIKNYFNVDFSTNLVALPKNYVFADGQICKYNLEYSGIYYGAKFYVCDGRVHKLTDNIEWMVHPGLIFNAGTKKVSNDYQEIAWLQRFLEDSVRNKPVQIPKNIYGGYDIVAAGKKIISFKDGKMTWINQPVVHNSVYDSGLYNTNFIGDSLDFSKLDRLYLEEVDVSNIQNLILNQNATSIYLNHVIGLHGELDFSNVRHIAICGTDVSKVNIKLNPNAQTVDLTYLTDFHGEHDLSGVEHFDCVGTNCDDAELKLNPSGAVYGMSFGQKAYQEYFAARKALTHQVAQRVR